MRVRRRGCLLVVPPALLGAFGIGAVGRAAVTPIERFFQWWTDNDPPKITLNVPLAPIKGRATVGVQVDDTSRWQILSIDLDGVQLDPAPGDRQIDTAKLPDGVHILRVRAADRSRLQNVGVSEALFVSRNSPPKLELDPVSKTVGQGETLLIRVSADEPVTIEGLFDGTAVRFVNDGSASWALAGIDNLARAGNRSLRVAAVDGIGNRTEAAYTVAVTLVKYPVEDIVLPPSQEGIISSPTNSNEISRLDTLFAGVTPTKRWDGKFTPPVNAPLISEFGTARSYNGGPVGSRHWGADFDVQTGTAVLAGAAGKVVLVDKLDVRGNVVILDHGLGVFSCHYHLSKQDVKTGDEVGRGVRLGLSGATGAVTGPHLHWEMRVRGMAVDPIPWTKQAYP